MVEWALPPWVVNANCTEEMLALLFRARTQRLRRLAGEDPNEPRPSRRVSNAELFKATGCQPKVVVMRKA